MLNAPWIVGEVARLPLRVTDANGLPTDPASLRLKVKAPDGTVTTTAYGAGPDLVKDAVGVYRLDLVLTQAGTWHYRWETDAPAAGAAEGGLTVRASRVI